MISALPRWVAGLHATIQTKLLVAFSLVVALLLSAAAAGLLAMGEMRQRTEQMVQLQRKIAAYRQLSHDTVTHLYGVSVALVQPEERKLDATLRQLKQFGYDIDRLQFLAQDELDVMDRVRVDFEEFIRVVTRSVELIREGRAAEGQRLQLREAAPLAERLERLTNELVNKADADLVGGIDVANAAYEGSRKTVIICAMVSVALALGLGYLISSSLIGPIKQLETRMNQLAGGDFFTRVTVPNKDEIGGLAADVNRMSDELGRLYAQVEAAREHAERANLDKSRFLAAASHDLRQPMHALNLWIGNLRLALDCNDRANADRAVGTIENACKSMSSSFNAILDLSKLDARGVKPEYADVNISQLLQQIYTEFEALAQQKRLDFRFRASPRGPIYGRTDPVLLARSIRNLVSNAIKYTEAGGVVLGEVVHANEVEIAVCDSGIGISQEHMDDVFSDFYRVAESGQQQGMGLGLPIVQRSVRVLAKHSLDYFSRLNRGSRFSIRCPKVSVPCVEGIVPLVESPRSGRIAGAYVVVVEDEPSVLHGLVELLSNWGCLVQSGRSGREMLRAIQGNERLPDLLITDWRLADGETGLDAANLLRQTLAANTPVLVITGDAINEVVLDDPAVPVKLIHKPITTVALRAVLEDLLPVRRFV